MKYSCNRCKKKYPCIIETICCPEPPYSCIYANDETDIDADWKEMKDKDFEMNGLCADCSNCADNCDNCKDSSGFINQAPRQSHEAPLMSENLRSAIDAENEKLNVKDPKSRYYDAGVDERKFSLKIKGYVKELNITFKA